MRISNNIRPTTAVKSSTTLRMRHTKNLAVNLRLNRGPTIMQTQSLAVNLWLNFWFVFSVIYITLNCNLYKVGFWLKILNICRRKLMQIFHIYIDPPLASKPGKV